MHNSAIRLFLLTVAVGIAGCGQRHEVTVLEVKNDKPAKEDPFGSEPNKENPPMHKHHKHAFADPAEMSKKWNDPERDKWQHPEEIVAALALKPGATVADIGAGTGYMVAPISKAVGKDGTVITIDASAEMVEYLTKRKGELGPAKIVPQKVGFDDPELPSASVDRVLTQDTWHHIKGQDDYAMKVYNGLKRGGRFVIVEYEVDAEVGPPKAMRLDPKQVTKQLEAAGFRVEIVKESMLRHYLVVGHKD
eukprot:TRINITY_DN835_c0_g1_i4.p2 TRINITY_DN835_c0_g1~~TRINITY_DN835_c0_g1_i4.p2  ORF type:complete len:249 (+),score=51.45 TRINITY_DN835_c0_g1_i4:1246-1992(+)